MPTNKTSCFFHLNQTICGCMDHMDHIVVWFNCVCRRSLILGISTFLRNKSSFHYWSILKIHQNYFYHLMPRFHNADFFWIKHRKSLKEAIVILTDLLFHLVWVFSFFKVKFIIATFQVIKIDEREGKHMERKTRVEWFTWKCNLTN